MSLTSRKESLLQGQIVNPHSRPVGRKRPLQELYEAIGTNRCADLHKSSGTSIGK